ncbi:MAG: hypothetical protein P857_852 [Candidatus Xenolissoclinum pacificiensis L6]|uniref:Uncharacterized protein n=1 Tax=Candidatus Xenolissoclinum pacificiensis L6 TaxID=1401685 RepID=W2V206_9RICK|nr:MAG: hypothetical protein P857_852 [Candidatus Xenolissoclinum pacificiensis L6]
MGKSKGGFTSKALIDALGNPLKFIITGGNRNDIYQGRGSDGKLVFPL